MEYSRFMDIGSQFHAEFSGIAIGIYDGDFIIACEYCDDVSIKIRLTRTTSKQDIIKIVQNNIVTFVSKVSIQKCPHMRAVETLAQINRVLRKYYDTEIPLVT